MPAKKRGRPAGSNGMYYAKQARAGIKLKPTGAYGKTNTSHSLLGIESKFFDVFHNDQINSGTNATWVTADPATEKCLSACTQGEEATSRDGRQYVITSLHIKGFVQVLRSASISATPKGGTVRLLVVHDKQTNGTQLAATEVMNTHTGTFDFLGFRNLEWTKRYTVLMDTVIDLSQMQVVSDAANLFDTNEKRYYFEFNRKFKKGILVNTTGTTAVVDNIADNSLHMIASAEPIVNGGDTYLIYRARMRFQG